MAALGIICTFPRLHVPVNNLVMMASAILATSSVCSHRQ